MKKELAREKFGHEKVVIFRSKEMTEAYRSVYCLRQQLLSLKEGLEIKKSTGHQSLAEQSDSSDAEEESGSLQTKASGTNASTQNVVTTFTANALQKLPITPLLTFLCVHNKRFSLCIACQQVHVNIIILNYTE